MKMYKTSNVILLVLNATLGSFYFGYAVSYMNVSFDAVDEFYRVKPADKERIHGLLSGILIPKS